MQPAKLPEVHLTASGPRALRRLGLGDVEFAINVVDTVMESGELHARVFGSGDLRDPLYLSRVVVAGVKAAKVPIDAWVASLLAMPLEDVTNPDKFNLGDLGRLIQGLQAHPDLPDFLPHLTSLGAQLLRWMKKIGPASSTASNGVTAGTTTT